MPADHYPVLIALAIAFALGGVILTLSWFVSRKMGGRVQLSPYESGEPLLDSSRKRISILFFLIAIDFVVFDVETVFLFPWAVRYEVLGLFGLIEMGIFLFILVAAYVYIWKKGALQWV